MSPAFVCAKWMVAVLAAALSVAACGGTSTTPETPTIEDLRRRAEDRPRDAEAQRALAIAELLMAGGDASRAEAQIARALALAPDDPRLLFVAGAEREQHGHPREALAHYLDALDAARASAHPLAPALAEVTLASIAAMADGVPGFVEAASPRLEAVAAEPGTIGAAARHQLDEVRIELAYRRGDPEAVRAIASEGGCATTWCVAGPFGPWDLLGFDRDHGVDPGARLAASYDLGEPRGERPTRELETRGCAVHLGGPIAAGGTTFAQTEIEVAEAGPHLLRVETPNAVEVFVDGASIARLDRRVEPIGRVTYHPVRLEAGTHRITAKVSTRHPNPVLSVAAVPGGATPEPPEADGPLATYLAAAVRSSRGDAVGAREVLRRPLAEDEPSAWLLTLGSSVALSDPVLPGDVRRDEARRLLREARGRDDQAWFPALQLARLASADGRTVAAIDALRQASERWPEVVHVRLYLADLLLGRGWYADAGGAIDAARRLVPDACPPIEAALALAERRHRTPEVARLSEALVACDARASARYDLRVSQRRWDEAARELERLARLEPDPNEVTVLSRKVALAEARGDDDQVIALLSELRDEEPRRVSFAIEQIDQLLAEGQTDTARARMEEALRAEPAAMADLHFLRRAVDGEFVMTPYRKDGSEIIASFEASGRTYDEPQVLVFDYTVVRVFEDGSSLALTHNIWKLQSEESLDEQGEFEPPEGARVLTLRTVKGDGRRIEPDHIEGKDTVSLPSLAPGDYVEYEYVQVLDPPGAFPGGYLGDRFYFRSIEVPFDRSELTVVLPEEMDAVVEPRGPAPETEERTEDGLRVLHWGVEESRPLTPEPMSVAPREFIPSVNVGVDATWEGFVDSIRDLLADREVRDPAAERQVAEILGGARGADDRIVAQRLYAWVLENVEEDGNVFGLAPAMLADRTGSRARVLAYLLDLAGVDNTFVLGKSAAADSAESRLPDEETYDTLLVRVDGPNVLLSTAQRGAPFGFLPPLLRGQRALVLADGAPVIPIPGGESGADRRELDVDVDLNREGGATIRVVETYHGAGAVSWRDQLEGVASAVLEQRFEEAYVARLVPGAELQSLRITGRDTPERPLVFEYVFDVPQLGRRQGERWIIPGLFPSQLAPMYARLGERTTTQLVAPPLDVDVRTTIDAPPGGVAPEAPRTIRLDGPGNARFWMQAERRDGTVVVERSVRLPVMRVTPEEYAGFARFLRAADQAEARELTFVVPR